MEELSRDGDFKNKIDSLTETILQAIDEESSDNTIITVTLANTLLFTLSRLVKDREPLTKGTKILGMLDHGLSLNIATQVEEELAQLEPKH